MKRWSWILVIPLFAILWYEFLTSPNPGPPPATMSVTSAPSTVVPEDFDSLITLAHALSSADAALQHAAEKALARIPYQQRRELKQVADDLSDDHAQSLLLTRVAQIDELLATDPPPVSLHVKDASLAEIADRLSTEMGVTFQAISRVEHHWLYTLSVDHKPFWDVIRALNDQHPVFLSLDNGRTGKFILNDAWAGPVTYQVNGHFAMFFSAPFDDPQPNAPPTQYLIFGLAADPRMHITRMACNLSFGTDDTGHPVLTNMLPGSFSMPTDGHGHTWMYALPPAATPRHIWKSLILPTHFSVSLSDLETTIDNAEQGFTVKLGDTTIACKPFNITDRRTSCDFTATLPNGANNNALSISLYDASGALCLYATPGNGGNDLFGTPAPPYRAEIRLPAKTRDVFVPFEMRDLPLSAQAQRAAKLAPQTATAPATTIATPPATPTLLWRTPSTPESAIRAYPPAAYKDMPLLAYRDRNANDELLAFYPTGEQRHALANMGVIGEMVIAQDKLFLAGSGGTLQAVSLEGSGRLWSVTNNNTPSPPAVDKDNVVYGELNYLHALDAATGKQHWRVDNPLGLIGVPALDADKVYLADDNGNLAAFDLKTGKELQRVPISNALATGPVLHQDLICVGTAQGLLAADRVTFKPRWTYEPPVDPRFAKAGGGGFGSGGSGGPRPTGYVRYIMPAPLVRDDVLYYAHESGLYAVNAATGKLLWQFSPPAPATAPAPTTRPAMLNDFTVHLHKFSGGTMRTAGILHINNPTQPVLHEGTLYLGAEAGVYALAAATGKQRWFYPTPAPVAARPALAGQSLCVALVTGETLVLQIPKQNQ